MAKSTDYIPGACNIGGAEVRLRRLMAWCATGATLLLWVGLMLAEAPPAWRLLVFFPATLAVLGFLQAAAGFCVKFGLAGVFNFDTHVGRTDPVDQADFRRQDRRRAVRIIAYAVAMAALVAAAAYLVPM
jgi:hypothetical protein